MSKSWIDGLSNKTLADKLRKDSAVIIDHLAFSFPNFSLSRLNNGRNLYGKGSNGLTLQKIPKFSDYRNRYAKNEDALEAFQEALDSSLILRLVSFCTVVLGFQVSSPRDKGLHGYTQSYRLLDKTGRVELGFIALGGNNSTVYIQISGQGCKHLFDHISRHDLHYWLHDVLQIDFLARIDLAYDCFDGNFDCEYAVKAYRDDAFKNPRGGQMPTMQNCPEYRGDKIIGHIVKVGSRKSSAYWRIYDKGAEQGLDTVWYRSEVELKKVSIEALLEPAKAFANLNAFSSSLNIEHGICVRAASIRAQGTLVQKTKWLKRQCGRMLTDLIDICDGDIGAAVTVLLNPKGGVLVPSDSERLELFNYMQGECHA